MTISKQQRIEAIAELQKRALVILDINKGAWTNEGINEAGVVIGLQYSAIADLLSERDTALAENVELEQQRQFEHECWLGAEQQLDVALAENKRLNELIDAVRKSASQNYPAVPPIKPRSGVKDRRGIPRTGHVMAGKRVFSRKGYPNGLFNDARTGKADRRS